MFGFANMSQRTGRLNFNPKLPENWSELVFPLTYQGRKLKVKLTHQHFEITKLLGPDLAIEINGRDYLLSDTVEVEIKN